MTLASFPLNSEGWREVTDPDRKLRSLMCLVDPSGVRHAFGDITPDADFTECGLNADDFDVIGYTHLQGWILCEACAAAVVKHQLWESLD